MMPLHVMETELLKMVPGLWPPVAVIGGTPLCCLTMSKPIVTPAKEHIKNVSVGKIPDVEGECPLYPLLNLIISILASIISIHTWWGSAY